MKLDEIAQQLDLTLQGEGSIEVQSLAPLSHAGPGDISFINAASFLDKLKSCCADAVIVKPEWAEDCPSACLISADPYVSYARLSQLLYPSIPIATDVHERAVVHETAQLAAGVCVGPNAVIEAGVVVGEGSQIGPGCFVGRGTRIGQYSRLYANSSVYHDCILGDRVTLHSSSVIGADGFGFANEQGRWIKIQQVGRVVIGNDVEVGACTTIDRGAMDDTVISNGVILDNLIQIAHNVTLGEHTAIAAGVAIAGSTEVGAYCAISGAVGIIGHAKIVDHVTITGMSMVTNSILEPGVYSSGMSAMPNSKWRRNHVWLRKLEELAQRVKTLERRGA